MEGKKVVFSLQDHLNKGLHLDVKDIDGYWKLARIIEKDDKCITIRYDAWDPKFQQLLSIGSSRIAPLRLHTEGYTGPQRKTARDFLLKLQTISDIRISLQQLLSDSPPTMTAYELTQFLRGEVFVQIDSLLAFPCNLNPSQIKAVVGFLEYYVAFSIKYCEGCLKLSRQHFQDFVGNKQAYLTNYYAAQLAAVQQVVYSLLLIFTIKGEARNYLYTYTNKFISDEWESGILEKLKQLFAKKEGFKTLKKLLDFKDSLGRGFPSSTKKSCILLLHFLGGKTNFSMPTLQAKDYNEVYKLVPIYLQFFPKQQTQVAIIQFSTLLAIANGNSFDAKLRGINQLKQYLQRIRTRDSKNIFKYISQDRVYQVLKYTNFLEAIIDFRAFNSEVFRRAVPMIRLISEKKALTFNNITQMFRLAQNKHQSEIIMIYGVLSEIGSFAPTQILDHIFSQILKLKLNEMTITLIRDFTIKAIDNIGKQSSFLGFLRKKKCSSKYEYYGLNLLWKQIQDQSPLIDAKLLPSALEALKTIFGAEPFKPLRDTYMNLCLENIRKKKSLGQSLRLLLNILQSFSPQAPLIMGEGRPDVVSRLDKKYQIIETISSGLRKTQFTKMSSQQCLQYFFEFLEEYNSSLKQSLRVENVKAIWRVNQNQVELLNFLKKSRNTEDKQYKRKLYKRISQELMKELFVEIFLMGEYMNNYNELSPLVYDTVDELFLSYNHQVKNIEYNDKSTIRLISGGLFGEKFYENILLANRYSKTTTVVINKARKRYVELYTRPKDYQNVGRKVKIWNSFLDRVLQLMVKNKQTMIPVLLDFLKQIEGKMVRQNVQHNGMLQIDVRWQNIDKTIRLARNSTIFKLRKTIMKEYNMDPAYNFVLQVCMNRKEVSFTQQEDFSVNAIDLVGKGPSIKVIDTKGKHPHFEALQQFKTELSYRQSVYTQLLDMLSLPDIKEDVIWQVLQQFPRNRNVYNKLQNIASEFDAIKWKQFFTQTHLKKLNYKLRILNQLINKPSWVEAFKITGGFDQLVTKSMAFSQKDFYIYDNVKCVTMVINTVYNCFGMTATEKQLLEGIDPLQFATKLMSYILMTKQSNPSLDNAVLKLVIKLSELNNQIINNLLSDSSVSTKILYECCFIVTVEDGIIQNELFVGIFTDIFAKYLSTQTQMQIINILVGDFLSLGYLSKAAKSQYYFEVLLSCLERMKEIQTLSPKLKQKLTKFPNEVFGAGIRQQNQRQFNGLIYGALKLKSFLLRRGLEQSDNQTLIKKLIEQYLFHSSELAASYIQSKKNTIQLYHLLQLLFATNPQGVKLLSNILVPKLQKAVWRRPSALDWMLEVERQEKKAFSGLKNLRATCYINCLLQQLFMIQPFRDALLKVDTLQKYNPVMKENQMFQLQKIFAFLKYSQKTSYNPKDFCEAFKDFEGKSIDVNIQSDVDEFFNALMQKLENLLKSTSSLDIINNVFRGTISNQLVCEGCPHSSEREQGYLSLGVHIKNKNSLDEALKGFIEGQILDGDNAYFCQACQKKVRTLKRLCIKTLPNVLIVVLKRFQFNYDSMKKIKVNDYCSFPQDIDMKHYTAAYLSSQQKRQGNANQPEPFMPDSYYQYKLRGVVVHYGSSEAGHYYSYIRDNKQWFEFNDQLISGFNPADLPQETYGGSQNFGSESQSIKSEKCRNAYLLFYERENFYDFKQQPTPHMIDFEKLEGSEQGIKQLALQDNSSFQFSNIVFDKPFAEFMRGIILLDSKQAQQLGFLYFHIVFLRMREKDQMLLQFTSRLQSILRTNQEIRRWYLAQFTKPFIREFFIDAPKLIRFITVGLAKLAISLSEDVPDNLVFSLMSFVTDKKNMTPFCKLLTELSMKPKIKELMMKHFYPQRVVAILLSDSSNKFEELPSTEDSNDFGLGGSNQRQRQKGYGTACTICLIESLKNFQQSVTIEDLQQMLPKISEKINRKNIAKMATTKTDIDLKELINRYGKKMINGEDGDIKSYMYWYRQILNKHSEDPAIVQLIVEKHMEVMEVCCNMYYPFDNLFNFMIKFCTKFPTYKAELRKKLELTGPTAPNTSNKHLKMIEGWITKSGIASRLVYNQDWKAYKTKVASSLPQTIFFYEQKKEVRQKQFDTIIKQVNPKKEQTKETKEQPPKQQALTLGSDQELGDTSSQVFVYQNQPVYKVKTTKTVNRVKVVGRAGLLFRVDVDGILRWYCGNKDQIDFHNSIL